ncbi:VPLPA-CTERM sorting domain-containing protein [Falsiruegeria mediterranea]|uniref:VPLPA-CTERM sorting domain-containing protein n=1 Tax=Falsiruegeria mediterranea TaxID=1280832 RepID=UPI0015F29AC2|nr:VPLPA-CTERM sorting domain-containing protein [Falsiruegeria mediterranea]
MLRTLTIAVLALGTTIVPAVSLADVDGPDFFRVTGVAPVPLPAIGFLLLVGFGGLAGLRRRKKT